MKNIVLILVLIFTTQVFAQENKTIKEVEKFQQKLNQEFASKETSPLHKDDLKKFKSLDFFPIDTNMRVVAKLKLFKNSKPFTMQTTTDRLPVYKIYATATFELQGKTYVLHIYQNQKLILTADYKDYLFLPFTDDSNGDTTYGGGRYIDLQVPTSNTDTIVIDFNKAYNPFCAYNHKYSCPIPPPVNHLNTKILAGVKAF